MVRKKSPSGDKNFPAGEPRTGKDTSDPTASVDNPSSKETLVRQLEEQLRVNHEQLQATCDMENLELADIIDAPSLQALADDFYELCGMPLGLIDIKGTVLVGVGWQDVCTKFHRVNPETCKNCIESDTLLSAGVPHGEYKIYKCKNNMWDVATPVMVGDRQFGNLFMGQFFFEDESLDYELFRSQAREYGFDEKEYIAALETAPRLSRETLNTSMAFFMKLTDILSKLSYGNLKLARSLGERDALMESLRESEEALKKLNEELENRVAERTEDLADTVTNLKVEIAERKNAEESVLRLNRLYAVLSETNQAIVRTMDTETLFNDFCRIAVEQGNFNLAWVGLIDEESGELKIVTAKGVTSYLDGIKITVNEEPTGIGPTGIAVREGTYYICNDFLNSTITRPWHERARAHDIRASASIVLKQEGRVIGALTLYANEKDFFDRQQVELIRQMGADVSFALDNIVRETRRQKAERALLDETAERLRAMEALREKEQMLIQQSRQAAMGEMIGNIAHQWRQPLNTLGLEIQKLLLFYDLGEFDREFLNKGVSSSMELIQHMSRTIDDFRNYFMPDKEKAEFKAFEAINNTISLLEGCFSNPKIGIVIVAKDRPIVYGYRNEFAQAILNVLVNARDAIVEREIKDPQVTITLSSEHGRAVVTVADNAGGIPEEIMGKIFDPYFTTKGPQNGTGLGLFMSKTIIENNMGGRLTVRNSAHGAEFRIEVVT